MAVTRNDVARAAGVSPAVVSYVLNDGPRPVSAASRAKVLEAIARLGYTPDGMARYMKTGKTKSVGLVLPDIALPYFAEFTKAMSAAAYAIDHQLLIANTDWQVVQEHRQIEALVQRRVDAMVLMSVDPLRDLAALAELDMPVVIVDRPGVAVRIGVEATEHLIAHGHRRVAIVMIDRDLVTSRRRMQGWTEAMERHGLPTEGLSFDAAPTRGGGHAAALEMLSSDTPPTAVFVESDAQAVGVLRAVADLRLEVPGDLAVFSSEGTELAQYSIPRLSTIRQPTAQIARESLELALAAEGPGLRRLTNEEYALELRDSCGCGDA